MTEQIKIDSIYSVSEDIIAREIEGELIIIPISGDIGEGGDDMYSFNDTGRAIWNLLDGNRTINQVIQELKLTHEGTESQIENDVLGLMKELLERKIIVKKD